MTKLDNQRKYSLQFGISWHNHHLNAGDHNIPYPHLRYLQYTFNHG